MNTDFRMPKMLLNTENFPGALFVICSLDSLLKSTSCASASTKEGDAFSARYS